MAKRWPVLGSAQRLGSMQIRFELSSSDGTIRKLGTTIPTRRVRPLLRRPAVDTPTLRRLEHRLPGDGGSSLR